jgi:hypothetical protein
MSYCRFSNDCDVYIFPSGDGIHCCACQLGDDTVIVETSAEMLAHVEMHLAAGHRVPGYAIERLRVEIATDQL